jgi:hypothetical protein
MTIHCRAVARTLVLGSLLASAIPDARAAAQSDPEGFVSKGRVQSVLGLDNAELQARAESLSFYFEITQTYDVPCRFVVPFTGEVLHEVQVRTVVIHGPVAYETRGEQQVTGFELLGFSEGPFVEGGIGCRNGRTSDGVPVVTDETTLLTVDGMELRSNGA